MCRVQLQSARICLFNRSFHFQSASSVHMYILFKYKIITLKLHMYLYQTTQYIFFEEKKLNDKRLWSEILRNFMKLWVLFYNVQMYQNYKSRPFKLRKATLIKPVCQHLMSSGGWAGRGAGDEQERRGPLWIKTVQEGQLRDFENKVTQGTTQGNS